MIGPEEAMARRIPERRCVACRQTKPKRELVRLVRTSDGTVAVDPTGKRSGRGVYICSDPVCWSGALKGTRLEGALRAPIPAESRQELAAFAAGLKGERDLASSSRGPA